MDKLSEKQELNRQADIFAYNFLMPEKEFKKTCKKLNYNSWCIAGHFDVPREKVLIWAEYHEIKMNL